MYVCVRELMCVYMYFHGYVISALEKKYVTDFCENVKPYFYFLQSSNKISNKHRVRSSVIMLKVLRMLFPIREEAEEEL